MAQGITRTRRGKKPTKQPRRDYVFPVVIEKDEDGYFVSCRALQGCYTQGETYEETLANIEEAVRLHVECRLAHGEAIPTGEAVILTTIQVRV